MELHLLVQLIVLCMPLKVQNLQTLMFPSFYNCIFWTANIYRKCFFMSNSYNCLIWFKVKVYRYYYTPT